MKFARFGVSVAGLVLEDLLKIHTKKTRRINSMIDDLHDGLNFLYDAPNNRVYESMWKSWVKDFKKRTMDLELSEIIRTHCLTTVVGICRQKRREYMINKGGLGKKQRAKVLEEYNTYYNNFVEKTYE